MMGITWAGAAIVSKNEFPGEDSCYRALEQLKVSGVRDHGKEDNREYVIFCRPKKLN